MARWRRIDAPCDDGEGLLDDALGVQRDTGERPDFSRAQGFNRGEGADQHHRALSTPGIFVPMGVGGFPDRGLRSCVVVCHRSVGRFLHRRYACCAPDRGHVGPREGEEREEGDGAVHEESCV